MSQLSNRSNGSGAYTKQFIKLYYSLFKACIDLRPTLPSLQNVPSASDGRRYNSHRHGGGSSEHSPKMGRQLAPSPHPILPCGNTPLIRLLFDFPNHIRQQRRRHQQPSGCRYLSRALQYGEINKRHQILIAYRALCRDCPRCQVCGHGLVNAL